jgi:hypothetical protein
MVYIGRVRHTKVEEIDTIVLLLVRAGVAISFSVTAPDNEDVADDGAGMTDAGGRDVTTCLEEGGGIVSCAEKIEVVAGSLTDETAEKIEVACSGGGGRKSVAVSRERGGGWGGGGYDAGFVEGDGRRVVEASYAPGKVMTLLLLLLLLRWGRRLLLCLC